MNREARAEKAAQARRAAEKKQLGKNGGKEKGKNASGAGDDQASHAKSSAAQSVKDDPEALSADCRA